ncbi:unnamed protein product [Calypogeia fissa]
MLVAIVVGMLFTTLVHGNAVNPNSVPGTKQPNMRTSSAPPSKAINKPAPKAINKPAPKAINKPAPKAINIPAPKAINVPAPKQMKTGVPGNKKSGNHYMVDWTHVDKNGDTVQHVTGNLPDINQLETSSCQDVVHVRHDNGSHVLIAVSGLNCPNKQYCTVEKVHHEFEHSHSQIHTHCNAEKDLTIHFLLLTKEEYQNEQYENSNNGGSQVLQNYNLIETHSNSNSSHEKEHKKEEKKAEKKVGKAARKVAKGLRIFLRILRILFMLIPK